MNLKDKRFIINNIPTIIQKEMNEDETFRECVFESQGLVKYKDVKEKLLEFENFLDDLENIGKTITITEFQDKHNFNRNINFDYKYKFREIFGDFKEK